MYTASDMLVLARPPFECFLPRLIRLPCASDLIIRTGVAVFGSKVCMKCRVTKFPTVRDICAQAGWQKARRRPPRPPSRPPDRCCGGCLQCRGVPNVLKPRSAEPFLRLPLLHQTPPLLVYVGHHIFSPENNAVRETKKYSKDLLGMFDVFFLNSNFKFDLFFLSCSLSSL